MTKIVVLSGGISDEREVSLRSGAAVTNALQTAGYAVSQFDPRHGIAGLLSSLDDDTVVFPVLHGKGGEDGTIQAELEAKNARFVGSDSKASALCFDKWEYFKFLEDKSILLPKTELVDQDEFEASGLTNQPFVLKPVDGGSSIDTFIVRDPENYNYKAIEEAFDRHDRMLLQELIEGQELTVGVLGESALPVIEIIPPSGAEFDYENKYNGATIELCPPQTIPGPTQREAQNLALKIHNLTGCRDFSRTDFIMTEAGKLYVLETNTIPGMTDQSLLPKAAYVAGLVMPDVVDQLVKAALSR